MKRTKEDLILRKKTGPKITMLTSHNFPLDILGFSEKTFRHAKKYADASQVFSDVITNYISDVQNGYFPTEKNSSTIPEAIINQILAKLEKTKPCYSYEL